MNTVLKLLLFLIFTPLSFSAENTLKKSADFSKYLRVPKLLDEVLIKVNDHLVDLSLKNITLTLKSITTSLETRIEKTLFLKKKQNFHLISFHNLIPDYLSVKIFSLNSLNSDVRCYHKELPKVYIAEKISVMETEVKRKRGLSRTQKSLSDMILEIKK